MSTETRRASIFNFSGGHAGCREAQTDVCTSAILRRSQAAGRWTLSLAAFLVALAAAGCSTEQETDATGQMVMVDQETGEAMVLQQPESFPAIHPTTGKRTLMPGLYCPDCRRWYPTPPPEVINRQPGAGLCPKTKTPLTAEGPWPEQTAADQIEN